MLVIHVDDILITGDVHNAKYTTAIKNLQTVWEVGETVEGAAHKHCGGQIYKTDYGIEVSYAEYMRKLCPSPQMRYHMSASEVSKYRALIGALQWPSSQGLPMLSASISLQAGAVSKGTVQDIQELHKTEVW